MAQFLKVNGQEYPVTYIGKYQNADWGGRSTQTLYLQMTHAEIAALLPAGTPWSIIRRDTVPIYDEETREQTGTQEIETEEDMSAYSMSGAITDYRDGTVSITMGKPTEVEALRSQLNEIEEAYDAE